MSELKKHAVGDLQVLRQVLNVFFIFNIVFFLALSVVTIGRSILVDVQGLVHLVGATIANLYPNRGLPAVIPQHNYISCCCCRTEPPSLRTMFSLLLGGGYERQGTVWCDDQDT